MTRVLMIVSNGFTHDPRVSAEASSLAGAGYEVTVLAWDRKGTLPPDEVRDGVRTVRVRNTFGMRLRRYDFFRLPPFWRLALERARRLHSEAPFDVVHCHDLDTLPVGVRFKAREGAALVYDAHEIFPYLLELSRARRWSPKFEAMERDLVPNADVVIAAGPPHRDYLAPKTDSPIEVVFNSRPLQYEDYAPSGNSHTTIAYLGGLDPTRLLVPLAEVAVEETSLEAWFAGEGPLRPQIESLAARSGGSVRFLGLVPMSDVLPLTRKADLVFSMFDPQMRLNRIGVPNKFFEALVAGRPILVSAGTWIGTEVEKHACGLAVEYTKAALRSALVSLRDDPSLRERLGRNALNTAKQQYNWPREEAKLLSLYDRLPVREP